MLKALKGQAPALLRHPSGAAVIDDAFTAACAAQRNAMAAEFYGREFTLFEVRSLCVLGPGFLINPQAKSASNKCRKRPNYSLKELARGFLKMALLCLLCCSYGDGAVCTPRPDAWPLARRQTPPAR